MADAATLRQLAAGKAPVTTAPDKETPVQRLRRLAGATSAAPAPAPAAAPRQPVAPAPGEPAAPTSPVREPIAATPKSPTAPVEVPMAGPDDDVGVIGRIRDRITGADVSDPRETSRVISQLAGSIAGGSIGARVPPRNMLVNPITGAIVGGTAGSLFGATAPEALIRGAESVGLVPPGTAASTSLSNEELQTVLEGEALLEVALQGTLGFARLAGRATARAMTGFTQEQRDLAERAGQLGIDMAPVTVGDRAIGRGFVSVMGRFPLIGTPVRRVGQKAELDFATAVQNVGDRIAPIITESDLGRLIYDDAQTLLSATNKQFAARYGEVWERADAAGVVVRPRHTVAKANELKAQLVREAPQRPGVEGPLPKSVAEDISNFIDDNILNRVSEITPGGAVVFNQTLRQMDTLASRLDEKLVGLEPGQQRFARSLVAQLKTAVSMDILTNAKGAASQDIVNELKAIDQDFSQTMEQLFETAGAKRFGSVRRRGLRAAEFDDTTRTPIDKLARIVLDANSPQMIDEVQRLVTPETFQSIAASYYDKAMETALRQNGDGSYVFSSDAFERALGLDNARSPRREVTEKLLQQTAGISPEEIQTLVDVGRRLAGSEIPNASQFVARRGVLGGRQAVVNALLAGGTAGTAAKQGGVTGRVMSALVFLAGARGVSAILANPDSARAVLNVAKNEAQRQTSRGNSMRALRTVLTAMNDDDLPGTVEQSFQLGRLFLLGAEQAQTGAELSPSEVEMGRIEKALQMPATQRDRKGFRTGGIK